MIKNKLWFVKQVLPLKYKTKYSIKDESNNTVMMSCTWRMWFGHPFHIKHYKNLEEYKML